MRARVDSRPSVDSGASPAPAGDEIAGRALLPAPAGRIPPPFKVATLDQPTLLTAAELHCAAECRVARLGDEKVIVKYDPARTYLTMTPTQWRALRLFGEGRAVPQVVFQAIVDRMCPPLREFYELVVKAQACGILLAAGQPGPAPVPPARWQLQASGTVVRWAGMASILIGLVTACARPLAIPENTGQLLLGWAVACACVSLGYFLGAGVVRHAGAEVYHPEFRWKTLSPHFHADLHDAIMAGPQVVGDVALGRIAPAFLVLGATAFFAPGVALVLFCTVLALLSPFWWSPGLVLVHAHYGTPQLDAVHDFQFHPNRDIWYAFTTRLRHTDLKFLGVHSLYGTIWLGLVLLTSGLFLRANAEELWTAYIASNGLHFTALALLALLGLAVVSVLGVFATIGAIVARNAWRERQRRRHKPQPADATPEAVRAALAEALLFKDLAADDRAAIAAAMTVESFRAGVPVITEGETGDKLYVVYSGEVEVLRRLASGAADAVARLGPGDLFGEIAVLNASVRTRTVNTVKKSILLSLTKEAFTHLVLSRVSRTAIEETIQKIGFLQRSPIASSWLPHAMAAFARRAVFRQFPEGAYVIREGEDNDYFFMLYEGELSVRHLREEIARLHIGEFFGEISLLQNSLAKATIVARTPARCLAMNKRDFLQFLANDFVVGLQFEAISSKRLGHAIFPLKGRSFDVLRT